jgi:ArsR family transcriptional regulator
METEAAILALAALAQPTHLEAFRHLIRHVPEGGAAGELARHLAVPLNTLSAHLSVLSRARLGRSQRHSRSIVYHAELEQLRHLVMFLHRDCYQGRAEICAPILVELVPCCPSEETRR